MVHSHRAAKKTLRKPLFADKSILNPRRGESPRSGDTASEDELAERVFADWLRVGGLLGWRAAGAVDGRPRCGWMAVAGWWAV